MKVYRGSSYNHPVYIAHDKATLKLLFDRATEAMNGGDTAPMLSFVTENREAIRSLISGEPHY